VGGFARIAAPSPASNTSASTTLSSREGLSRSPTLHVSRSNTWDRDWRLNSPNEEVYCQKPPSNRTSTSRCIRLYGSLARRVVSPSPSTWVVAQVFRVQAPIFGDEDASASHQQSKPVSVPCFESSSISKDTRVAQGPCGPQSGWGGVFRHTAPTKPASLTSFRTTSDPGRSRNSVAPWRTALARCIPHSGSETPEAVAL